ncbi:MAG: phosphoglycerate dehydrogenase [Opitutales bacterium]
MKILVLDKIADAGIELFRQQPGYDVIVAWEAVDGWDPKKNPGQVLELVQAHPDAAGIAVRSDSKITAEVMEAAGNLKVVGRAGVGVDNIQIDSATDHGVIVMNTPGGNTIATAELTFTHLLCAARPICPADADMKAGKFPRKTLPKGTELRGKTLGVCGLGRIGTEVARRAQAFEMKVLAYDPYVTPERARSLEVQKVELDALFAESDYLTFHVPKPEKPLVDSKAIAKMKPGVRMVNVARGGIIDEAALVEGLKSGHVAWAGLDVFEDEPPAEDHPLRSLPNVNLTPHLGASTVEAQESVGVEIAEQMIEALNGGMVRNAINAPSVDPKTLEQLRPYLELGEKLGSFLQQLGVSDEQVVELHVTYTGKLIDVSTVPVSRAIQRGYLKVISPNVNDVNAPKKLEELGIAVDFTKSNAGTEYSELITVRAKAASGKTRQVAGTLFGPQQQPRIVEIDGHAVEVNTKGRMLVLKNNDVPGIVGFLGTTLGNDGVNIANLSLARDQGQGFAISVYEIDSAPSAEALEAIKGHAAIQKFRLITL